MKTTIILFLLLTFTLTHQAGAQENHDQQAEKNPVSLEVKVGPGGGSYYDVPSQTQDFDKYGIERASLKAFAGEILIEAGKLGTIDYRKMQLGSSVTNDQFGTQSLLNYSTSKYEVSQTKAGDVFLRNRLTNINHEDRLIFYRIDNQTTPQLENFSDNIKIDQNILNVGPEIGLCKKLGSKEILPFTKVEGFAELGLQPLGMMVSNYKVVERNSLLSLSDDETSRLNLSTGGIFKIVGMITYKEKLYFRIKFDQSVAQAVTDKNINLANRELEFKLGYKVTPRLAVSVGVENNELVTNNNGRRAIDVANIGSVGVSYTIGRKKK